MVGFTMPASFQNIEEAGEIGVEIGMGILQRVTDTSLRGKVHDGSEFVVAKHGFYALAIGEIDLVKTGVVEFAKNGEFRSSERSATRTQRDGDKAFRSDGCRLDQLCEHRKSQWLRKLSMAQVYRGRRRPILRGRHSTVDQVGSAVQGRL